MPKDNEIFDGKTFQDLTRDIYENSQKKKIQIDLLISEIHGFITTIDDVIMVAPIIKEYMDASIKNDEHLVKLAGVLQRIISKSNGSDDESMLLSDNVERKIELAFLLKDLFNKDKMLSVYTEEMSNILKSIDQDLIPANYIEAVNQNIDAESEKKIKFDNEIIHRSKIIKHFIDNNEKNSRTENDFKSVYKKVKKNKKYFVSIKDIVVLESLAADGVVLPSGLNYSTLASELTIPKNLQDLVSQNQLGLVMLKIVEIIGEDEIKNLDPETLYFLNRILNDLNLKKIRNKILSKSLPLRI